ncbi:IS110 family transposase [Streptomyces minutiscleroticus]|uniref:IS110 family transposase n=1 Tax=Streptomyces minutiscleroticus TaxID=68238 RepID=A0A918UB64_9ACTN|nr:IS110 family transposase [Streptomyces minutiscleroticus]GGY21043.1 IS110 family transposase [Streptomyces minutiscleroticus]
MGRCIGMDIHRDFAQVAVVENGLLRDEGRVDCRPRQLREWAQTLRPDDQIALEATANSAAIAVLLEQHVARVVISNPVKTRAIAEAKVKTDKVDARILAQLLAADFLPGTWLPDEHTRMLRRVTMRRAHLVRQCTRAKNQIHSVLHRNLLPRPPVSDLFGRAGRAWLGVQTLPADEQSTVQALLRQLDFQQNELAAVERELAADALGDPTVRRLMTIPGVDAITGITLLAAVGDFGRFPSAGQLVSYFGLNPKVRQSGGLPAQHGHITKAGRTQARAVLVEAAFAAARGPGPLRAFYRRIAARRGTQIALVATARKLAVLSWHLVTKQQDYAFARPSLVAFKQRKLELTAGLPTAHGNHRGAGYAYNKKELRAQERAIAEQAERAYQVLISRWQPVPTGKSTQLPAIPGQP